MKLINLDNGSMKSVDVLIIDGKTFLASEEGEIIEHASQRGKAQPWYVLVDDGPQADELTLPWED